MQLVVVCSFCVWNRMGNAARQPDIPPHRAETQGGLLVPAKGVDEAKGRDREQVGEEATMGK